MTILVDEAVWPWRGRLWAHLTSDVSMRELHAFAERLEIPRRGFGGDHYDVPEEYVDRVVEAGAHVVSGRELVARLTSAGLRRRRTAAPVAPRVMLIGMMGAGKTTVGQAVAHRTGWAYFDNDAVLAEVTGHPLRGGGRASRLGRAARRRGDLPTRHPRPARPVGGRRSGLRGRAGRRAGAAP